MPKSLIDQIKDRYSLVPFVAHHTGGLKYTSNGFFIGHCPFHQKDKPKSRPKFWVSSRHNVCGCFVPRCVAYANHREDPASKPLDIINFYALLNGCSLNEAIHNLADIAGIE